MAKFEHDVQDALLEYVRAHAAKLVLAPKFSWWSDPTKTEISGALTETFKLAEKEVAPLPAVQDGPVVISPYPNGRMIEIPAFSDGTVSKSGVAEVWCLVRSDWTVLVSGLLAVPQTLIAGNSWGFGEALQVRVPDSHQ